MSERSLLVKQLPCLACELEDVHQPNETEEHHLNLGGNAGQLRRGDEYSVALCKWHHRAIRKPRMNNDGMTAIFGPSLALDSRQFRDCYGSDDQLLARTNAKLQQLLPVTA